MKRLLAGVCLAVLGTVGLATPASADAPGPTDYRSEIVEIEPSTPTIHPSIVGGDSFVRLQVDAGVEAIVAGYEGEGYLWFRADGDVFENQNSPATYVNSSRYGGERVPDHADADAEPDWTQVASGGDWAWHDHRAHWMHSARPFGVGPGDQILESVIPITVDGTPVDVTVTSTWLPEASPVPAILGAIGGVAMVALAWALRRRPAGLPPIAAAVPVALLTLLVGSWQYVSLPASTGPRPVWFVLPLIATLCAAAGTIAGSRGRSFVADALLLMVGVELAIWGYLKREGLTAAIVPTDAPQWLDRLVTAMGLASGVGFVALALWSLFAISGSTAQTGSPRPVHP
ncbi:MAG: hypothetical protein WBP59_12340 [Ilumatobacteraceae bacterium]